MLPEEVSAETYLETMRKEDSAVIPLFVDYEHDVHDDDTSVRFNQQDNEDPLRNALSSELGSRSQVDAATLLEEVPQVGSADEVKTRLQTHLPRAHKPIDELDSDSHDDDDGSDAKSIEKDPSNRQPDSRESELFHEDEVVSLTVHNHHDDAGSKVTSNDIAGRYPRRERKRRELMNLVTFKTAVAAYNERMRRHPHLEVVAEDEVDDVEDKQLNMYLTRAMVARDAADDWLADQQLHLFLTTSKKQEQHQQLTLSNVLSNKYNDLNEWMDEISGELDSLFEHTLIPFRGRRNMRALPTFLVLTYKFDTEGNIVRRKARLVVCGQRENVNMINMLDPTTTSIATVRFFYAFSALNRMVVVNFDFVRAFLTANISRDVYVKLPKALHGMSLGGHTIDTDQLYKLGRAMYGLVDSPSWWQAELRKIFEKLGFQESRYLPGLFIRMERRKLVISTVFVDDGAMSCEDGSIVLSILNDMMQICKIKVDKAVSQFLGMNVVYDNENFTCELSMRSYIESIIGTYDIDLTKNTKYHLTPIQTEPFIEPLPTDIADAENLPYRQLIGTLLWIASATRPDISYTVSVLASYLKGWSCELYVAAQRALHYLYLTRELSLKYGGEDHVNAFGDRERLTLTVKSKTHVKEMRWWPVDPPHVNLICVTDSSFGNEQIDWRSQCGDGLSLNFQGFFDWQSKRQTLPQSVQALSTIEAEYKAMTSPMRKLIWYKRALEEIGAWKARHRVLVVNDNIHTVSQVMSGQRKLSFATRHLAPSDHFICDLVHDGQVMAVYMKGTKNPSDVFTKPLPRQKLEYLRLVMMGHLPYDFRTQKADDE
jgi:hypothetical protein